MNALYIMLAIGFGYWIGNAKSPQVVFDSSKCPSALEQKVESIQEPTKPTEPVTVEPFKDKYSELDRKVAEHDKKIDENERTDTAHAQRVEEEEERLRDRNNEQTSLTNEIEEFHRKLAADPNQWAIDQMEGVSLHLAMGGDGTAKISFDPVELQYISLFLQKCKDNNYTILSQTDLSPPDDRGNVLMMIVRKHQ